MKLSILTWNVGLLESSAEAPLDWTQEHAEAAIRAFVLECSPDFVCFQELPGIVPFVETHDMVPANTRSHSGDLATLCKHAFVPKQKSRALEATVLTEIPSLDLAIANVHLPSGNAERDERLRHVQSIQNATQGKHLLILGDTNTRLAEEADIANFNLRGTKPPSPTWDSKRNRFHEQGRAFTAYFTRYFHSPSVKVENVKVWKEPQRFAGAKFYLSEHYALSLEVSVLD